MADLKISALNSLAGADLVAADVVAVVDDSASETKKLTVSDLIANGSTLISDNTIPSAKILFSAGAIDTAELAASSVETAKINDSAVTAAKLADNSSVTLVSTLPASGDFTGQIALDTDDDKIYIWDGSAWDSVKGAGSINVVNGSTTGEINIVASTSGDTVTISATLDDTSAAAQFLGGPTGAGGTVGYRALVGTDLPTATTSAKGGVIVNGNGLTMSGDTITIDNTVTAEATDHHIVQYDANGLVTGGREIVAADVPVATSTSVGVVKPGSGLGVDAAGEISHSNSITGATAAKVTFDAQGHITATEALAASDIPDLDTAKITTGTFPEARIGSAAVSGAKLKDYAVAQISETTPTAEFTSQFFFNPITRDLFLWDGNVFQPVGISAGEIVLAGTYDASTNLLDSVTADGTAAGFTNGASLPSAAAGNNRHYVVVSQSGTGSAPAPTVTLEPPDILLSNGTSYVLIETSETITAQIASNVGFTATGNIAATNVQAAVAEVDSEKVAKAGDTMTGNLNLGEDVVLTFEGATDNAFETTLTVVDPTADRTLSLPNISGTLISSGDTGTVTSTMILDGTIANADISASAEIAVSKLGNGSARQVLQTDSLGTGVEFTDDLDLPGTLDVTGAATLDSTLAVTGATTVTGVINADGKVKFPAGSASAPSFYSGTDTNTGLYFSAADEISVATGGTQRFAVDSSGRLLVGTSTSSGYSSARLIVNSAGTDSTASGNLVLQRGEANGSISNGDEIGTINFGDESGFSYATIVANADLAPGSDSPGRLVFSTTADGASSPSERLRIDSSGRLLVGTTTAPTCTAKFQGRSDGATNSANLRLAKGSSTPGSTDSLGILSFSDSGSQASAQIQVSRDNGTWTSGSRTPGAMLFMTAPDSASGAVERLRIDSSGNVGIGTSSPTSRVHALSGASDNPHFYFKSTESGATNNDGDLFKIEHSRGAGNTNALLNVLNSAESVLYVEGSGNVGIGTTAPQANLDISPASSSATLRVQARTTSSPVPAIELVRGTAQTFGADVYQDFRIKDSAGELIVEYGQNGNITEALRVDSVGNVGIGTTSPNAVLTTDPESGNFSATYNNYDGVGLFIRGNGTSGSGNYGPALAFGSCDSDTVNQEEKHGAISIVQTGTDPNQTGLAFWTHPSNTSTDALVEKLRIDSSGNVGIGTTSPGSELHLAAGDTNCAFKITNTSGGSGGLIQQNGSDFNFNNLDSGNMRFYTADTERMRIDSSGRVGVGTT